MGLQNNQFFQFLKTVTWRFDMENKPFGVIYRITNLVNGKMYIGQTIRDVNVRFKEHISSSKNPKKPILPLSKALNKYGVENFCCQVIKVCYNREELNSEELRFIEKYKTNVKENGYNVLTSIITHGTINKMRKPKKRSLEQLKEIRNKYCLLAKAITKNFIGIKKKKFGNYEVNIRNNNTRIYCGTYITAEEAAKAYDIKAIELYGNDAVINFDELREEYINGNIIVNKTSRYGSIYSEYTGVSFHKKSKRWYAQTAVNNKSIFIGSFSTAKEAALAYDEYVLSNNLNKKLNFPT